MSVNVGESDYVSDCGRVYVSDCRKESMSMIVGKSLCQ